ncbi:MAG: SpvB/TcaC N-terminal domain-containing protein, partial [Anaerolineales bacterium]
MFANQPWKKTAFSVLLIAAILLHAFVPLSGTKRSVHAQGEEPTATPTETVTVTPTPPSPTPTVSLTPTPIPPTIEEVGTSTPEATATVSATPTPSAAVAAPNASGEASILILLANPDHLTPGGNVMLRWEITDPSFTGDGFVLKITLPEVFALQGNYEGIFDDTTRTLTIAVNNSNGQAHLRNEGEPSSAYFNATLWKGDEVVATTSLFVPLLEQFVLDKNGGEMRAMGGKVRVEVPTDALPEKTVIEVGEPSGDAVPPYSLLGRPFELKAHKEKSGESVRKFSKELSIFVSYEDLDVPEALEGSLYLYWFDENLGEWAALPTIVNKETKTLRATTDHFTVFDIGVNNWQSSRLPTVDSFQVAEFTGAGTYSYPINVPPGPGGFQPSLALSYNSQIVDQATLNTPASWVGMGWSLDVGSIELDLHGTPDYWYDDTYLLNLNGVSTRIVQDANGVYHTTDENFLRITFDGSKWTIWDKKGDVYYFDYGLSYPYQVSGCPYSDAGIGWRTYRWPLTRVRNIFNQEIQYFYYQQTKTVRFEQHFNINNTCKKIDQPAVTATYLSAVTYANGKYRIRFELGPRADYPASWDTDPAFHAYEKYRLSNIYVEQDADGNGAYETILRRYELAYKDNNASDIIFPGYTWSQGGKTNTLASIREFGVNNAAALPPVTFTYGDNLHLTRVDNGYGGSVVFNYELWYYQPYAAKFRTILEKIGRSGDAACYHESPVPWVARPGGEVGCHINSGGPNDLKIRGTAYKPIDNSFVRPGGVYKLSGDYGVDPGTTVQIGLFTGITDTFDTREPGVFLLPANASTAIPLIKTSGPGYAIFGHTFKFELLTSIYRVKEKRISDGNNHTYTYGYAYSGAAVNDLSTSPTGQCGFTVDIFGD